MVRCRLRTLVLTEISRLSAIAPELAELFSEALSLRPIVVFLLLKVASILSASMFVPEPWVIVLFLPTLVIRKPEIL